MSEQGEMLNVYAWRWPYHRDLAAAGPLARARAQRFDCMVEPAMTLEIGSSFTSTLASAAIERGNLVKRGQVLARLDSGLDQRT